MIEALKNILTGKKSRRGQWVLPLLVVVVGFLVLSFSTENFASGQNMSNLLKQAMPLIIVAIGQMIVILLGGMDLSVGSIIGLTTAILAIDAPVAVTIPLVVFAAVLVGFINGFSIVRLNVHPIIATLSMQFIVLGVAKLIRPVAGGSVPEFLVQWVNGTIFGVSTVFVWAPVVVLIGWKLIHGSRYGLHLFAIGGGAAAGQVDATHNFGIPDRRNIIFGYILSALFAALAGAFLAGRIASGDPNVGTIFALDSVTAVAIGGTHLSGGIGGLHGTLIGAVLMALLSNGMNLANLSAFLQGSIKGGILLFVVVLQSRKKMGL